MSRAPRVSSTGAGTDAIRGIIAIGEIATLVPQPGS
jgi:hypothetical protein